MNVIDDGRVTIPAEFVKEFNPNNPVFLVKDGENLYSFTQDGNCPYLLCDETNIKGKHPYMLRGTHPKGSKTKRYQVSTNNLFEYQSKAVFYKYAGKLMMAGFDGF